MKAYVNYGNFLADILAVVPLDYFTQITGFSVYVVNSLRLFRILKIFRILELANIINKNGNVRVRLSIFWILMLTFVFFAHYIACIYYFVGYIETPYQSDDNLFIDLDIKSNSSVYITNQ